MLDLIGLDSINGKVLELIKNTTVRLLADGVRLAQIIWWLLFIW